MKRYEYDATLHIMFEGLYFVFPWDVPQEFGKEYALVYGSLDGRPYELFDILNWKLENETSCYIIPLLKETCEALNKRDGDTVHVVIIDEEQADFERKQADLERKQAQEAKERLFSDMLKQTHLLIAGPTGSGKSNIINSIIFTAIQESQYEVEFILIDPKRIELVEYRDLPHTMRYDCEPDNMVSALEWAIFETDIRYHVMQNNSSHKWHGSQLYVIIENFADLLFYDRKTVLSLVQCLSQSSRAAGIHLIVSAQSPLAKVIPSEIRVNFTSIVALKTRTAQESRSIIGYGGCEKLARYSQAYYITPEHKGIVDIPKIEDDERHARVSAVIRSYESEKARRASELEKEAKEKAREASINDDTVSDNTDIASATQKSIFQKLFRFLRKID